VTSKTRVILLQKENIMENVKSGIKTTEFWLSLIGPVILIFVTLGVFTPEEGEALSLTIGDAIAAIGAFIAGLAPVWAYIRGRSEVKAAATAK
jgi:hypothetical protein